MFILRDKNKIISISNTRTTSEYEEATDEVSTGFDGYMYYKQYTITQEYQTAKQAYEIKQANAKRITELKSKLASYDYIGNKIATGRATIADYATEIAQMTAWANEINELEAQNAD